ncbi:hypothetical protein SMC26_24025 [Actinomadura fulvescens]|uniref:Uncharacterized protein n=1 Tax=Actinomadura fulvescens TaxID=46160 RepID=A0ABP6CJL7_9ACTN
MTMPDPNLDSGTPASDSEAREHATRNESSWLRIGAEVRIRPDTAPGDAAIRNQTARGFIALINAPAPTGSTHATVSGSRRTESDRDAGPDTTCIVRFPGIGEYRFAARSLEPAPSFPVTRLQTLVAVNAADADATLVTTAARILRSHQAGTRPDPALVADRDHLAAALGAWAGTTGERVLFALGSRIRRTASGMSAAPVQARHPSSQNAAGLAAQGFPNSIADSVNDSPGRSRSSDAAGPSPTSTRPSAPNPSPRPT